MKPSLPPLIPIVRPYVDATVVNLVEPNTRRIIQCVVDWLDNTSHHPRINFIEATALRIAARRLTKEASRLIPPEASHGPTD